MSRPRIHKSRPAAKPYRALASAWREAEIQIEAPRAVAPVLSSNLQAHRHRRAALAGGALIIVLAAADRLKAGAIVERQRRGVVGGDF